MSNWDFFWYNPYLKDLELPISLREVVLTILLIFLATCVIFSIPDRIRTKMLLHKMKKSALPADTELLGCLSGYGNTTGASRHREIWAAILIKTSLSEENVLQFYKHSVHKVVDYDKQTLIMSHLYKKFEILDNVEELEGYYIIERTGKTITTV